MQVVPLIAAPAQGLAILLDKQDCYIRVYQRGEFLFMDLRVQGAAVFNGAICLNRKNVKAYAYLPFSGGLHFIDLEGESVPQHEGLGSRFFLVFVSADEETPAGLI